MATNRGGIFRQAALDRLASPEQADTLMRVLNPAGWLALAAIAALLVAALGWGIFGSIPIRVSGDGVLLESGGVFDVTSDAAGEVRSLEVALGDPVKAGQVVAHLAQPDLEQQVADARAQLAEARAELGKEGRLETRDSAAAARALDFQRKAAQAKLETQQAEVKRLEGKVKAQEALVADGVITEDVLAQTRLDLGQAKSQVISGQAQVDQLAAEKVKARLSRVSSREERQDKVAQDEQQLAVLEERLKTSSEVVSAEAGRVVELMVDVGDQVQAGGQVVGVERAGSEGSRLQLVAYLSALDAYEVGPGMEVQAVPSVVKKEESGSLVGKVVSVADVPADQQDMMRVLGNQPLVSRLAEGGLPIEVRGDLVPDPETPSGYRWTSARGPRIRLHEGTLCTVSVVVREEPPIALAIPGLEKALGF